MLSKNPFDSGAFYATSFTCRWATYEMQNALELGRACLIVARHETSFAFIGAANGMKRNNGTTACMHD